MYIDAFLYVPYMVQNMIAAGHFETRCYIDRFKPHGRPARRSTFRLEAFGKTKNKLIFPFFYVH